MSTSANRRRVVGVAALGIGLALGGCHWKGGDKKDSSGHGSAKREPAAATQPEDEKAWQPAAVNMRVYPSSRFVQEGSLSVLEARIELLDEMGDTIKGSGRFHFELVEAATPGSGTATAGQRLYAWDVPLMTLEQQRQYWDPITRTYQFRLKMNDAPPPGATTLRAMLTPPQAEARHIAAEAGIRQ